MPLSRLVVILAAVIVAAGVTVYVAAQFPAVAGLGLPLALGAAVLWRWLAPRGS
ncbi:hypothetical protein [Actibacterium sp. D379-3]